MSLDLAIRRPVAAAVFEAVVAIVLVGCLIRYRLLPRVRFSRFLHFGGPWHITRSEFWEERGLHSTRGLVSTFLLIGAALTVLFLVLDLIF